jgi:hypothetical protein
MHKTHEKQSKGADKDIRTEGMWLGFVSYSAEGEVNDAVRVLQA